MIRVGPARMIVLKSGKYDLAEIALDGPIHLVGPNNVGKTSLIALLQFLYLDDQKAMHFCRDLQETRRYYFPDPGSYVIFECLTPTGFQTVVVHGLGPLHGFEFERFAYQGRFERDDYIDAERRVRPAEDVCARLAARSFVKLEPKHLRAALTGVGDSKDLHLGLVPLRNRGHYSRFRAIFRNLLRLAHLRQEELKTLLLDVFEGDFRQRKISLSRSYAQTLVRIRRDASEVRELLGHFRGLMKPHGTLTFFEYVGIRKLQAPFVGPQRRQHLKEVGRVVKEFAREYQFEDEIVTLNLPPARVRHLRFL
jgi:hypothetical protein